MKTYTAITFLLHSMQLELLT